MFFDLLAIFTALFIPIAIVYFQEKEKLSNLYFEYFLNFKIRLRSIGIVVSVFLLYFIVDKFNIISSINENFVGQQLYIDIIFYIVILYMISFLIKFYVSYYNFSKNSNSVKYDLLFDDIYNKFKNVQIKYKWKEINSEIHNINEEIKFSIFDSNNLISNEDLKLQANKVIYSIDLKNIRKFNEKVWIRVNCGNKLSQNTHLISFDNDIEKKKLRGINKRTFTTGIDYEEKLFDLLQYIILMIKKSCKTKNYQQYEELLRTLIRSFQIISEDDIFFNNIRDLLRQIYLFLDYARTKYLDDSLIMYRLRNFTKTFILVSISDMNLSVFPTALSAVLRKELIDFETENMINVGFIYDIYTFFAKIEKHISEKNQKAVAIDLLRSIFDLFSKLDENEINKLCEQVNEKQFLRNSDDISGLRKNLFLVILKYFDEDIYIENLDQDNTYIECIYSIKQHYNDNPEIYNYLDQYEVIDT